MNLRYIIMLVAAVVFALGSCAKKDNDELGHHHHEHSHGHEGHNHGAHNHGEHVHEGHNHEGHVHGDAGEHEEDVDVIELQPEVAARFGLATEKAVSRTFNAIVKAGGTVMPSAEGTAVVSAPTSGIVTVAKGLDLGEEVRAGAIVASISAAGMTGGDANRLAKVDLDAAAAEWERMETLYADRLVTLSEYNTARAAYERAKAAYSAPAASGKAVSPIAGVITGLEAHTGQFVEAGQPIATVAAAGRLLVRADVPVKAYRTVAGARDARVVFPTDGSSLLLSDLDGRRLDLNSAAASTGGYVPVSFSVRNDGTLIPGQALEIYILGQGEREALSVPVSALTEQQGTFFVFEQLDEDCYRRLPVTVGASDGAYVEITGGLKGGENIVTAGVTAVRLAQTSGAVPEGHTHSH